MFAGDERWDAIDDALDELSVRGWEIHQTIYGPTRHEDGATTRLEGFVMIHAHLSPIVELEQRIHKIESEIDERRREMAALPAKAFGADDIRVDLLRQERHLTTLRERLERCKAAAASSPTWGTPLPYGAFRTGRMSTEHDFKLIG